LDVFLAAFHVLGGREHDPDLALEVNFSHSVDLTKDKVHRHNILCPKDLIERVDLVDLLTTPGASCAPARRALLIGSGARTRPATVVLAGLATAGWPAASWLRSIRRMALA
jgi:hypothetical protein